MLLLNLQMLIIELRLKIFNREKKWEKKKQEKRTKKTIVELSELKIINKRCESSIKSADATRYLPPPRVGKRESNAYMRKIECVRAANSAVSRRREISAPAHTYNVNQVTIHLWIYTYNHEAHGNAEIWRISLARLYVPSTL